MEVEDRKLREKIERRKRDVDNKNVGEGRGCVRGRK